MDKDCSWVDVETKVKGAVVDDEGNTIDDVLYISKLLLVSVELLVTTEA